MRNILIVDDHPIVLQVMTAIVESVFPNASIYDADGIAAAEERAAASDPLDLVLLDLGLPGCTGISALTCFATITPQAARVVISANDEARVVLAAFDAGAKGYIPKTLKPPVIAAALQVVAAGSIYVPPQVAWELAPKAELPESRLTGRQTDVLRLITLGLANKEVARRLRISEDTVKQHARAAYAILNVSSRAQLMHAVASNRIDLD